MSRTKLLGAVMCAMLSTALGQQSNPQTPEDALTIRELIAWSQLQKPQPAPQPLPPQEAPVPQPEQPRDQQAKPPADPHRHQEPMLWLSGRIVRDGSRYVLQLSSNPRYQLEVDSDIARYESRNVCIFGPVNTERMAILPLDIKLLS